MTLRPAFPHAAGRTAIEDAADADGETGGETAWQAAWSSLHAGDGLVWPAAAGERAAWAAFHAGRFDLAIERGRAAGGSGEVAADRAQLARASYLEPSETIRLRLCGEVVERAGARRAADPGDANAHHLYAVALARQSQGANIGRALSLGLLGRIRAALETALALAPEHVHAHIALGAFHADVIDKLGALIARTQGIGKDTGLALLRHAGRLDPDSVLARNEYAHALVVLEGEVCVARAASLYRESAAATGRDAVERLEIEIARQALDD